MNTITQIITSHNEKKISYTMLALAAASLLLFVAYLVIMVSVTHTGYAIDATDREETEFLETISVLENKLASQKRVVVFDNSQATLDSFEEIGHGAQYQTVNTERYSLAR